MGKETTARSYFSSPFQDLHLKVIPMLNAEPRVADEDDEDEVDEEAEDRQEPSEGAGTSGEASEKPGA